MSRWIPILRWYFANYPKIINAQECFKTQVWPRFPWSVPWIFRHERALGTGRPYYDILVYPRVWIITETQLIVASSSINFVVSRNSAKKKASWDLSFLFSRRCVCLQRHRDGVFVGARRHFLSTTCHGTYENGIIFLKKSYSINSGVILHRL